MKQAVSKARHKGSRGGFCHHAMAPYMMRDQPEHNHIFSVEMISMLQRYDPMAVDLQNCHQTARTSMNSMQAGESLPELVSHASSQHS